MNAGICIRCVHGQKRANVGAIEGPIAEGDKYEYASRRAGWLPFAVETIDQPWGGLGLSELASS
jgi:hypothetical protein